MTVLNLAHPSDLAEILALQKLCYHEIEPESAQSMLSKILISPQTCVTVRFYHQLQAYLLSLPAQLQHPPSLNEETTHLPTHANCLYLHDLAIHPQAQGTGLGQKLVRKFFQIAKEQKFKAACLIAIQNSVPFWQKQGFIIKIPSHALQEKLKTYGENATYMECLHLP